MPGCWPESWGDALLTSTLKAGTPFPSAPKNKKNASPEQGIVHLLVLAFDFLQPTLAVQSCYLKFKRRPKAAIWRLVRIWKPMRFEMLSQIYDESILSFLSCCPGPALDHDGSPSAKHTKHTTPNTHLLIWFLRKTPHDSLWRFP